MIHVIATITTRPGRRGDFLADFARVRPDVLAEAGCIEYGAASDVGTAIAIQSPPREDVVTVIEQWESVAALEAHLAAPHMARHRERMEDVVLKVELQVLAPTAGRGA